MKRLIILLLALMALAIPSKVAAQPLQFADINPMLNLKSIEPDQSASLLPTKKPDNKKEPVEPEKPKPVIYIVVEGDNLTQIGTKYNVEWQRLWAKNTQLDNPDLIHAGDQITIPEPSEQLSRPIPATVSLPDKTPDVAPLRSYDSSNTYDYGYCTWYVKNRRGASLPNSLGNANTWYARAQAMGMAVGSTPKPGAAGTTTRGSLGHVVYVESVNGDGTINISEMNYQGWGVVDYRTVSASEFLYIY